MFFTRKSAESKARTAALNASTKAAPNDGADVSMVLDALGGVLQGYARYALETESLDADAAKAKITDWMRHATIGGKHPTRATRSRWAAGA